MEHHFLFLSNFFLKYLDRVLSTGPLDVLVLVIRQLLVGEHGTHLFGGHDLDGIHTIS